MVSSKNIQFILRYWKCFECKIFALTFRSKSSCSNLMVFKEELQCYSVFPRHHAFCLKRFTTWRTSNYHKKEYFLLKYCKSILPTNAFETVVLVFYFVLNIELFPNIKKTWFLHTWRNFFLYLFINNCEKY